MLLQRYIQVYKKKKFPPNCIITKLIRIPSDEKINLSVSLKTEKAIINKINNFIRTIQEAT